MKDKNGESLKLEIYGGKMSPKRSKKLTVEETSKEEQKAMLKKEIGARIRYVRRMLGYTQEKMVASFDCGRANYSRIEKGEVFPNPAMLKALNKKFKVSLHWLICNKGQMLERKAMKSQQVKMECLEEAEIRELFLYMDTVPMVKHAVLGFFLEYKGKNKRLIEPLVKQRLLKG